MSDYTGTALHGPLEAVVTIPGSKSLTNRALPVAALAAGTSVLDNVLLADDTECMLAALRALGVRWTLDESARRVEVTGCAGHLPATTADLHCGNSGTTMRFGVALCAVGAGRYRLDGVERMRERPIGALADVLGALGVGIDYEGRRGYPPVVVQGQGLGGGHVQFVAPPSSQFVSGLLLAAPYARRDLFVEVTGAVVSQPYLALTTDVMEAFGVPVLANYEEASARFVVEAPRRYRASNYTIEPDASNASYFLAAPAVAGGSVTVEGLGTASRQGDARFAEVLQQLGCQVERTPHRTTVTGPGRGTRLRGLDIDLNDMPDMAQTLAVLALFADGPTSIRNVANLRVKETDRLAALATELRKLGAAVDEQADGLQIDPPGKLQGAYIDTYLDHRMAMSFALATLAEPDVVVRDIECCRKTFPDFISRWRGMIGDSCRS